MYLLDHIQRDWLYRRTAVATMRTLTVDVRTWLERVEIDTRNRGNGIDGRKRIGASTLGGPGRYANVGDVRSQLDDDRSPRLLLHPRGNVLAVLWHLPRKRPPAAPP